MKELIFLGVDMDPYAQDDIVKELHIPGKKNTL
jgi:hypothetical protein